MLIVRYHAEKSILRCVATTCKFVDEVFTLERYLSVLSRAIPEYFLIFSERFKYSRDTLLLFPLTTG